MRIRMASGADYWDLDHYERSGSDFPTVDLSEPRVWDLEELVWETDQFTPGVAITVLHPSTHAEVEVQQTPGGQWVIQTYGDGTYIEATTNREALNALYADGITAALAAARRAVAAIEKGQKPSLVDHIVLGTKVALNLPGAAAPAPDPDLVPKTTKPGVQPEAAPPPPDPAGEDMQYIQQPVPSTADVQAMRVQVAQANPHLSVKDVDDLVHDALVLAWRK